MRRIKEKSVNIKKVLRIGLAFTLISTLFTFILMWYVPREKIVQDLNKTHEMHTLIIECSAGYESSCDAFNEEYENYLNFVAIEDDSGYLESLVLWHYMNTRFGQTANDIQVIMLNDMDFLMETISEETSRKSRDSEEGISL